MNSTTLTQINDNEYRQQIIREYYKSTFKKYRTENPEVVKACQKRYYDKNKHTGNLKTKKIHYDKQNAKMLQRYKTDPEYAEYRKRKARESYYRRKNLKKEKEAE